ncbi:LysR family transcriptional regulator [Rhodoferax saidenbachensis]|uniref:DNA-binding transcriptional LysR family regulator n=1 Tax=Rhodoferax saidenbachensis TaxID=1484693 RepID=A0ABU1ZME9_9BURK|nr:LysR family transcriptional regulator [Rhodoferax saidenbachensis]MDR7306131.1 DNA-binding transcriptional LysR family regulator [Rhodoferax saidenbachensis]
MDKLKAMQAFTHIADQGSLTAAARAMDSSLPAVVRTLAALEAHLGVRLMHRTTRRLSLTEEGKHYLESCRQVLSAVGEAEAALSADASEPTGQLHITAPVMFGQMHITPAVMRFVQRYERVQCSVMLADRVVNLPEEGLDLGIRIGALDDSTLVAQPLGSLRRVVVASPDYLARHGVPTHPRHLLQANCIRFLGASGPWWTFHAQGKAFTVPVTGNLTFNHNTPVLDACLAGMGFGMFISYQVAPHLAQGTLQLVLEDFEPPPRPIHVVYPHARLLPARTRAFIDFIQQDLKGLAP